MERREALKKIGFVAASAGAGLALSACGSSDSSKSDMVPKAEYERVKADLERLQAELAAAGTRTQSRGRSRDEGAEGIEGLDLQPENMPMAARLEAMRADWDTAWTELSAMEQLVAANGHDVESLSREELWDLLQEKEQETGDPLSDKAIHLLCAGNCGGSYGCKVPEIVPPGGLR